MEDLAHIVVYPAALPGWEVLVPGCEEPECFDDRAAALAYAYGVAEALRPCRIQVEDWYGHIECEWTLSTEPAAAT